ncbi:GntR family transcriptional regulator [Cupriavidus lacunae]|uniref:GntR family transcriptional regulator n=1 Tax=Cupriavidus lacunae TaxID=2666307 RepID=A0A370NX46_9BURK|nr:GntR family transcriptional regulator [Cupriavidus lacunae]RDK10166.1 GntR family transcriptional regulator [Cupriavidus lacunae]
MTSQPQRLQAPQLHYLAVANELMEEILAGRLAVGEQLPAEPELVRKYQLSRYGVRQAIKALIDLGLVSRQQGIGTRVLSNQARARYNQSIAGLDDIARYAQETDFRILSQQMVAPAEGRVPLPADGVDVGGKWLHIAGLRSALGAGLPISLADIYVSPRYARLPRLGATLNVPVHALIERKFGARVTRVDQDIQGALVSQDEAALLQVEPGSAALRIVRTYFVDDEVIEVTLSVHPAERYSYKQSFELEGR